MLAARSTQYRRVPGPIAGGSSSRRRRAAAKRAFLRNCFDQLIDARFRRHPLSGYRGDGVESKAMLDPVVHSLADKDRRPILLVEPFEPSSKIHAVAQYRIIRAFGRAHISHHSIPEMDANASDERAQPFGFKLSIERVARGGR